MRIYKLEQKISRMNNLSFIRENQNLCIDRLAELARLNEDRSIKKEVEHYIANTDNIGEIRRINNCLDRRENKVLSKLRLADIDRIIPTHRQNSAYCKQGRCKYDR